MMIKSHHGVKRGVVNEGAGVKRAVGGDLEQARDGDSLGLHQHLVMVMVMVTVLASTSTSSWEGSAPNLARKDSGLRKRERVEREMFPEEADGCCESFKILKWGSKTWLLQQGMQWPPSQQQT